MPEGQPKTIEIIKRVLEEAKRYHKSALTKARPLTEEDLRIRNGIIQTKEGPVKFEVGDFLAIGVEGEEWPITAETMARTKRPIGEPDENGFLNYETTTIIHATQKPNSFTVETAPGKVLMGKPGDWLVTDGVKVWIVDQEIFRKTYTPFGGR